MAPGGVCVLGLRRARVRDRLDASPDPSPRTYDRRRQHGHRRVHGRAGTRRRIGRPHRVEAEPPTGAVDLCAARTGGRALGAVDRGQPDAAHARVRVGVRRGRRRLRLFDRENRVLVRACSWCRASRLARRFRWPCASPSPPRHDRAGRPGRLYGANTAGAAIGSLAAGFFLIPDPRPHGHDADRRGGECRQHRARALDRPARPHRRRV